VRAIAAITIGLGLLAGPNRGQAQGFIRHFDAEQAGKPGAIFSVREVPGGYLLFCSQVSNDGTNRTRLRIRAMDEIGSQQYEQEFFTGFQRHYVSGPVDPIANRADGNFAVPIFDISEGFDIRTSLFFMNVVGDTVATHVVLAYPIEDSVLVTPSQARPCADGGFLLCGTFDPYFPATALSRALLVRTDALGDTLWTRTYSMNPSFGYTALGVVEYVDGGAIIVGKRGGGGQNKYWLMRTNTQGSMLWIRNFGNYAGAVDGAVRLDSGGNIITFTPYRDQSFPNIYHAQFMLTKWNADGDIVWQKRSHFGNYYDNGDFEVLPDNSIIAVGKHEHGAELMRFSAEGDSLWTRIYTAFASQGSPRLFDVEPTSDGGFIAAGSCVQYVGDPTPFMETEWLLKTDSMGCVVPGCQYVGVQDVVVDLQAHLSIAPNPTSNWLQADLSLPPGASLKGDARAMLLNAQGQELRAWPMLRTDDSLHLKEDISALPSGVYFLHIADAERWLAGGKVVVE